MSQFTAKQRREIMAYIETRDGWKCQVCGKAPPRTGARVGDRLEIDHVVPLGSVRIGANGREDVVEDDAKFDLKNVRFACGSCNRKRQFEGKSSISELLAGGRSSLSLSTHRRSTEEQASGPVDPNGSGQPAPSGVSSDTVAEVGPSDSPTIEARRKIDYAGGPPQMQANDAYEPAVINYVMNRIDRANGQAVEFRDLIASAAQVTGCSIASAQDYMAKLASSEGPLNKYKVGNVWVCQRR